MECAIVRCLLVRVALTVHEVGSLGHLLEELNECLVVQQRLRGLLALRLVHDRTETGFVELCRCRLGIVYLINGRRIQDVEAFLASCVPALQKDRLPIP